MKVNQIDFFYNNSYHFREVFVCLIEVQLEIKQ